MSTAAAVSDMDAPDHALAPESTASDVGGSVDWSRNNSGGSFSGSGDFDAMANNAAEITLTDHIQGQLPHLRFGEKIVSSPNISSGKSMRRGICA